MDMNKVLAKYNITDDIRFMKAFIEECYCPTYDIVEYLRDWYEAKNEFLFKLFGDKVTVDCGEISFEKSYWDIECEMLDDYELCENRRNLQSILNELSLATLALPRTDDCWWTKYPSVENELFAVAIQECASFYTLFHNGATITTKRKAKFVMNEETEKSEYVYIHKHQKIAKILNNFYRTIEKVYPKKYTSKLAEARMLTSQVLAQVAMYAGRAKTTGRLTLSIHPFDYITMSQNDCGWSSCMALCDDYEDVGDYCAGTVALMNSKNTIIAYLDADSPYYPCMSGEFKEQKWNNKKYRNAIIIDPLLISAVKGYPNINESLDEVIINKLKSLAAENMGWTFEDEIHKGRNRYDITGFPIDLDTDKMYNDSHHWEALYICGDMSNLEKTPTTAHKDKYSWRIRYDGEVKCLECNEILDDSPQPRCSHCRGVYVCNHCGDEVGEDYITWVDDKCYCEYCYNEHFFTCGGCEERVESGFSDEGELANVCVYSIIENSNYEEKVDAYLERLKEVEELKKENPDRYVWTPSAPDKFATRHTFYICANCLAKAIEDGYIKWADYYHQNTKISLWKYFFLTNKALEDREFFEKFDYYNGDNNWKGIGYEDYCTKLANFTPVEELVN